LARQKTGFRDYATNDALTLKVEKEETVGLVLSTVIARFSGDGGVGGETTERGEAYEEGKLKGEKPGTMPT